MKKINVLKYYFIFNDYLSNQTPENLKATIKKIVEEAQKDGLI